MKKIPWMLLALALAGCSLKEIYLPQEDNLSAKEWTISARAASTKAYDMSQMDNPSTRTATAVYDGITGKLTFSSYKDNSALHSTGGGALRSNYRYNWYFLGGPVSSLTFPQDEADLAHLTQIRSGDMAQAQRSYGLDMAGKLEGLTPEEADELDGTTDGKIDIPLKSLWAKVCISIDKSQVPEREITIQSVVAGNGSRVFMPFSESGAAASSPEQMGPVLSPELSDAQKAGVQEIVLYYPENMQGILLPSNTQSMLKNPEQVSLSSPGKEDLVSYVTVNCSVSSDYGLQGTGTYRICIGEDSTSDFNICRGKCYNIVLTPTRAGMGCQFWKVYYDMTDTRSLSLKGVKSVGITADGPTMNEGIPIGLLAGGKCHAYARYSSSGGSGVDFTVAQYDAPTGWRVAPESVQRMQEAGIEWTFAKRIAYWQYSPGRSFFWTPEEYASLRSSHPGMTVLDTSWEGYFEFSAPSDLPSGNIYNFKVETFDRTHSGTISINTTVLGDPSYSGLDNCRYIGQRGRLTVTLPSGYTRAEFSVDASATGIVQLSSATNTQCTVDLLKAGKAVINIRLYNGTGWISTSPVTGQKYQVSFNVKAPVLKVEPGRLELSADGKPKPLQVTYCTQEGERMSIANAYASSSTVLNSELYNTYLSPLFTFSSGLGRFLDPGTSQGITEVGVRCLYKDGGTLAGYTGTWDETAIRVQPRNASQISRADIAVKVIAPFTYSGTTRLLGYIANHALDSDRFRSRPAASAMLVGEYLQNAPGIGASPECVSVECPASDIGLSLGSNGLLLVSRKDTPLVSSGKYTVSATLTNLVSGQTMTESIGYVEIYAIASIGAMANAPVEPSSLQNAGIMERYMVNSECIGIVADIPCSKPYGNVLSGVRSIRDALQGCNFLRYTGLPPRYANYERLLMAYVIPSDLWAVNVPIYVNMDYARDSAGKKISTEDVEKLLRYAESIGDFSMIRGCYWYEYSFSNYDAPKPPGMAVWTYRPGLNMKKEWNAMIAAEGGPESPIECFLEMNEPSIGVVTDAMDQVLTRYNSGTYWFYYTDSAEKGGLGLPYELLCVTPQGQTNCYWSSTTVSPDWP